MLFYYSLIMIIEPLLKSGSKTNFSLEALHKYFNKFYLLRNPGVDIGFYNFIQMCVIWHGIHLQEVCSVIPWEFVAYFQNVLFLL